MDALTLPEPLTTTIEPQDGPMLLRTVVPVPKGAPPNLAFERGGKVVTTSAVPCRFDGEGNPLAYKLTAASPAGSIEDEVRVVEAGHLPPGNVKVHPQTWDLVKGGGIELAYDVQDAGASVEHAHNLLAPTEEFAEVAHQVSTDYTWGRIGREVSREMVRGLGFRAWMAAYTDLPIVELSMVISNGAPGAVTEDFGDLALKLPEGWTAALALETPQISVIGNVIDLVSDTDLPEATTLPQLHEIHLRAILCPTDWLETAHAIAQGVGWGVVHGPWSYFSKQTPWYTAHGMRLPLPTETPFKLTGLLPRVLGQWEDRKAKLAAGDPADSTSPGPLGFGAPLGGPDGGFGGGEGLHVIPYPECAIVGLPAALQYLRAELYGQLSRGTGHLYDVGGLPMDLDAYAEKRDGHLFNYHLPRRGPLGHECFPPGYDKGNDPLGFKAAEPTPPDTKLHGYGCVDEQHGTRLVSSAVALAALDADPIAMHTLQARAVAVRASQWDGEGGQYTAELTYLGEITLDHAGFGGPVNRREAWNLWTMAEAQCRGLGSSKGWFDEIATALNELQTVNGQFGRRHSGSPAKEVSPQGSSKLRGVNSPWGDALIGSALRTLQAPGIGYPESAALNLRDALRAQLWAWPDGHNAPLYRLAIADENEQLYDSLADVPEDGIVRKSNGDLRTDDFYLPALLAMAAQAGMETGDFDTLKLAARIALKLTGDGDLMRYIEQRGVDHLRMTAYLVPLAKIASPGLIQQLGKEQTVAEPVKVGGEV